MLNVHRSVFTIRHRLVCVVGAVALAGCANTGFTPGDGGGDAVAGTCTKEGEKRCVGQAWQECHGGSFQQVKACLEPKICQSELGCVDCDPTLTKTCVGNDVYTCTEAGQVGTFVEKCGGLPCSNGACGSNNCSLGTGLIYLVDESNKFLSFNPENNANVLKEIGTLSCSAGPAWPAWASPVASPFSMSVDRQGRAWVLYTSGEIFWVDIKTAACQPSTFTKGQDGYELFGMGFVSDSAGSQKEKLFIQGGEVGWLEDGNLAYIDPATAAITTVGPLTFTDTEHSPELTGTGNGDLYGFFPNGSTSYVRKIDKASGKTLSTNKVSLPDGDVTAWAFAHWGGKFYIFVTVADFLGTENSMILKLETDTGSAVTLLENLKYKIVGAGVSTCAPVIE